MGIVFVGLHRLKNDLELVPLRGDGYQFAFGAGIGAFFDIQFPRTNDGVGGRLNLLPFDVHTRRAVLFGPMTTKLIPHFLAMALLVTSGCTRPATTGQVRTAEAYVPASGSVGFDVRTLNGRDGSLRLEATYESRGKLAKFSIEFGPTRNVENKDSKDFPMGTGQGRFLAEPGSDATALLADLQKALEAKTTPARIQRVQALPFMFVNLGDNLSQAPGGGLNANPPGGWTAIKIFIGEGEQEGQVFVNFNPAIGKGQFSIKDADYGDLVLSQLATVL